MARHEPRHAAQLFDHVSEAVLSLHPDELRRHRLQTGD
jgi:assimilatory nitrate reductase catalytic subunit